jgi:hypothetical protein
MHFHHLAARRHGPVTHQPASRSRLVQGSRPATAIAHGGTMTEGTGISGGRRWTAPARAAALAVALAGIVLLSMGCGGGGSPSASGSPGTGQGRLQQDLAFAHCMRSHGAPDFPDPSSSGGFTMNPSNSSSFQAPKSAREACAHLNPKQGATLTPAQQAQHQRQNLAFAACMRRHGFPDFPDGWSGNVGQLLTAGIDPNSPRFNVALTTCGF